MHFKDNTGSYNYKLKAENSNIILNKIQTRFTSQPKIAGQPIGMFLEYTDCILLKKRVSWVWRLVVSDDEATVMEILREWSTP